MKDRLDCEIQDREALAEILLTADLMIAASESSGHLSLDVIDGVLGVGAATPGLRTREQPKRRTTRKSAKRSATPA